MMITHKFGCKQINKSFSDLEIKNTIIDTVGHDRNLTPSNYVALKVKKKLLSSEDVSYSLVVNSRR